MTRCVTEVRTKALVTVITGITMKSAKQIKNFDNKSRKIQLGQNHD